MTRYICIHGHFYQPPRENPWLEAIEVQDSAWPYHDWNARIEAECYRTNGAARILTDRDRIVRIINNYERISFNFGPTLLSWLEAKAPDVYAAILKADRLSADRFGGHGSAMAQGYNHLILPLANARDKETQVRWGLADFEARFGRKAEGMWLPETAADLATLEVLADHGVKFTVLAPNQAARVRRIGEAEWRDVSGARIDPTRTYRQRLPSGRSIALFFYDGPVSRAVAFEQLLSSGERFAGRIADVFDASRKGAQLAHIATDGETYGHHHRHGEMALAYALEHIEATGLARLTNYGEFLERHPPTWEVDIFENSSWSCAHGVERWRSDCGCSTGAQPGWNQRWRAPLRDALDWLRDELAPRFEAEAGALLKDPWAARDAYVEVVLDRSRDNVLDFLGRHEARPLDDAGRVRALELLELQRHAMLMYTSCGWFFADLSGLETVQVLQYAGRAVQLAQKLFGDHVEARFLERLAEAESNLPEEGSGQRIYERRVRPAMVDLSSVAAHWAVSSLFESYEDLEKIFCYTAERLDYREHEAGRAHLGVGRVRITSDITLESACQAVGVVHFGDHNLSAGVRACEGEAPYEKMAVDLVEAFDRADLAETVRRLDRHFVARPYALRSLFRDEQRKILERILDATLADAEGAYRSLYNAHAPLMRFIESLGAPLPAALRTAAEYVLNTDLAEALQADELDAAEVDRLVQAARDLEVSLDAPRLGYVLQQRLDAEAEHLGRDATDLAALERLGSLARLARRHGFEADLWRTQNVTWELAQRAWPELESRARAGDASARAWTEGFEVLAEAASVQVERRR